MEEILNDYEEYNEEDFFFCMNCGSELSLKDIHEQESDLFPGEKVYLCIYCGAEVE